MQRGRRGSRALQINVRQGVRVRTCVSSLRGWGLDLPEPSRLPRPQKRPFPARALRPRPTCPIFWKLSSPHKLSVRYLHVHKVTCDFHKRQLISCPALVVSGLFGIQILSAATGLSSKAPQDSDPGAGGRPRGLIPGMTRADPLRTAQDDTGTSCCQGCAAQEHPGGILVGEGMSPALLRGPRDQAQAEGKASRPPAIPV